MRKQTPLCNLGRTVTKIAIATLAVLIAFYPHIEPRHLLANGNTYEFFRGDSGNYSTILGILPEKPTVGTVHFAFEILDASTALHVPNAEVTLVANNPEAQPMYQTRAVNTPKDLTYYDANLLFTSPGAWTLTIAVDSKLLGPTEFTIPFEIASQTITPSFAGGIAFIVLFAVLVSGGIYVWYSVKRQRRHT